MRNILDLNLFENIYHGKRVLVTGHTGFKGSWLSLWLKELGANVIGVSLSPEVHPNHWDLINLTIDDFRYDIRNYSQLLQVIKNNQPEIIFHLAAQPLVRRSYYNPLETWSTNVMGTVNLLEAGCKASDLKAIIIVTSDKCYDDRKLTRGYRENDRLGGHDPYSASKAGSEIVAQSYRKMCLVSKTGPLIATARAGNVIGGGDWSEDRIIPDLIRSIQERKSLEVRSPNASRPWQHVLEPISGYLLLGQKLLMGYQHAAKAWNFGPAPECNRTVLELLHMLKRAWTEVRWHEIEDIQPHETMQLRLDSKKANQNLNWQPIWNINRTVEKTTDWYKHWLERGLISSKQQLFDYVYDARNAKIDWAAK